MLASLMTSTKKPRQFNCLRWASLVVAVLAVLLPISATANDLKSARKSTNAFFKEQSFTAKIDLQTTGNYFVTPNGLPVEGKNLGRKKKLGIGQRDVAIAAGKTGRGIYLSVSKRKKRLTVALAPNRGITMHQARIFIQFDRPLEAADVTPEVIARALASYVEFTGVKVGSELDDAIDQLGTDDGSISAAPTVLPTSGVANLAVYTDVSSVERGNSINLQLRFDVQGRATSVTEQRELRYNGELLPSFPQTYAQSRGVGTHTSQFQQPIPASATPGSYEYKGEVCADGACMSRKITFTVE